MPRGRTSRPILPATKKRLGRYHDGDTSVSKKNPSPLSSSSIEVFVNDVLTEVLVDTGASISLINSNLLDRMAHDSIVPCSLKEVHTANCGFISLVGLIKLDILIGHVHTVADVYVTNDLICPMILGRDWIHDHQVTLCFSSNRLFVQAGQALTRLLPVSPQASFVMLATAPIVIPPFHEKFVSGYVAIQSMANAIFTPNLALQHSKLILLPSSVMHIRDHQGILSIVNNTRHSKTIPRDTPLGFVAQSTRPPSINVLHTPSAASAAPARTLTVSLVCSHCDVPFVCPTKLYAHLTQCCNKTKTCTHHLIHRLVEHLSEPMHKQEVFLLLHQYEQLFDDSLTTGIVCEPQQAVHTGTHPPLASLPRRISHLNREIINKEVKKLLATNIITPSNSSWASPVVIVRKRDGSARFCIDYRSLNSITQKDVYPLPRIDDVIERLNGSSIFSKLDLRSGYFQVPLAHTDREKTAFTTPDGLYQFNRLPQGLRNSPAVFQRLMNQTLGALRWDVCLAYLDDIVVHSSSIDQHLIDVNRVCKALHTANFRLNYEKCLFFQSHIPFLGHQIVAGGCTPLDDNIRAITQFPTPTSSKAAHSFLQMVGFYRKFIPSFAHVSAPLNKFTRKDFPFVWTKIEDQSFEELKLAITSPAVLVLPDPSKPYTIRTDASHVGIGGVLLQAVTSASADDVGEIIYRPIAFVSRSLKPAEKKYSAIELEALAIWWCVTQKFRTYIEGQRFFLETDHKPLLSLMKKPYHNSRIERWMTTLQQYDMLINHIPGTKNTTADALSRYPVDKPVSIDELEPHVMDSSTQTDAIQVNIVTTRSASKRRTDLAIPVPTITTPLPNIIVPSHPSPMRSSPPRPSPNMFSDFFDDATLNSHQNRDTIVGAIKTNRPLISTLTIDELGVLYKIVARPHQSKLAVRYIPRSLIDQVLFGYHNSTYSGAHYGIKRTFYKLRDRFYWPHMYVDIVNHVQSCVDCRQNKPSRRKPDGHMKPITPPRGTWERLAMDYVGPVPTSAQGNKYILVLTDLFSKFVVTKAVPDNTSMTAAKFLLYDVFMRYGVPSEIVTDNGSHFTSSLYESLVKLTGCHHVKTTPYNPQANGQCERHNATLVPNLVALSNQSRSNWDHKLAPTTFNYNSTQHDSTGFTPSNLMFARHPRFVLDLPSPSSALPSPQQYAPLMRDFIEHATIAARNSILHHQQAAKSRYDRHRSNPKYSVGQPVLIRNRAPSMNKFSPRFIGPYTVVRRLHDKLYLVQHTHNATQTRALVNDIRPI